MDKKRNILFILIILAAGLIAYANSFDCSFHFDDRNILNSSTIKSTATLSDWIRLFPTRPLGVLTFFADYHIHKIDVRGYHAVNLTIHLINALLVWWLMLITFSTPFMTDEPLGRRKNEIAFLTALLFVAHPLATQSVTYIVQRFNSLATLFYLFSMILFIKGRLVQGKTSPLLLAASVAAGVCGILTKEIVFTLPFALILYDYCFIGSIRIGNRILTNSTLAVSLLMLVIFISFLSRYYSLNVFHAISPDQGYSHSISMKEYFLTQFRVILTYIRLFFLPMNQNFDYDYPLSAGFWEMKTFLSFLTLIGILAGGILLFKKYRLIAFGIFWFFLTLSVESSIIPVSQNVIFEHRTYLPSIGFFIALTASFFYVAREQYVKIAVALLIGVAVINIDLTHQRNEIWKNEYTLWNDCLKKSPDKARVNNERGAALADAGRYPEAVHDFNKAIDLKSDYYTAYYNRGMIYGRLGQFQQALDDLNEAIRLKPVYPDAYNNLGNIYAELGRYPEAIGSYSEALRLMPDYFPVYVNRGNVYAKMSRYREALDDYNRTVSMRPDYMPAYESRARVYWKTGDENSACLDAERVCRLGDCRMMDFAKGSGHCLKSH